MDPTRGFYTPLDAFTQGRNTSLDMAKQRAALMLQQIEAARKNEMIDAEMAARKAQMENARMQAESYAKQVQMQEANANRQKPYDEARAAATRMEGLYAPLNSIYEQMNTDIPQAAHSYNQIRDQLPPHIQALERSQEATFSNPNQPPVLSRFNPEAMRGLMEGLGRPSSVAKVQQTGMQSDAAEGRNVRDNETRLEIARLRAQADEAEAAVKAQGAGALPNYEKFITSLVAQGAMTKEEGELRIARTRLMAAPGAYPKPGGIDLKQYGVKTNPPATEQLQAPALPQGWSVKPK